MIAHHDDVIKWKIFPRYLSLVWDILRSPVYFPHKGQWRFDDFIDMRLDKCLSKHSRCRSFETPLNSLWRHRNARTSWHGNLFQFTAYLWRKDISHRWFFPHKRPVVWSFDVWYTALKKCKKKQQSSCLWLETPWLPCEVWVTTTRLFTTWL